MSEIASRVRDIKPDAIIIHANGVIRFINPAGCRLFGYDAPDEILGKSVLDFVPSDQHETAKEIILQIESEEIFQFPFMKMQLISKDGSNTPVEATSVCASYKGSPAVMSIIVDRKSVISENSVNQLPDSIQRRSLQMLINAFDDGIAIYDKTGRVQWTNQRFTELIGKDICGMTWTEWKIDFERMFFRYSPECVMLEDEYPAIRALRGESIHEEILQFRNLASLDTIVSVDSKPFVEDGEVAGAVMFMRDASIQEEKCRKMLESHERVHNVLDSIQDGIASIETGRITYANRRMSKILGIKDAQIGSTSVESFKNFTQTDINSYVEQAIRERKSIRRDITSSITFKNYLAIFYPSDNAATLYLIEN